MTERTEPASAEPLAASLVRLVAGRRLLGTGFTLPGGRVATCAHVIAGFDEVHAQFPLLGSDGCAVEVVERDDDADIAILRLLEPPERALPTPVRLDRAVREHRFSVFGFSDAQPHGVWVSGSLAGAQGEGRVQMRVDPDHELIVRGFSGAPVWDEELHGVVGMVVTRSGTNKTTAHLVPVSFLGEWTVDARDPYRGLERFERDHATLFHGRDAAIEELLQRLESRGLVAVVGPSGSGKSSLVRAGVLPRLEQQGRAVVELRPGDSLDSVPVAVGRTALFLDQFEESVIADPEAARERLTQVIDLMAAQPGSLRVVLTLRSRSLDSLIAPGTREKLNDAVWLLEPMGQDDFREAIVRPAEDSGFGFEVGLVDAILHDCPPEHGTLPLLSEALKQLSDSRHGSWLTHAAYQELGRLPGALRDRADAVLAELGSAEAAVAKRLLINLTRPDGDGGHTRRRVEFDELDEAHRSVADRLAHARLVVRREGQVELPHQALIDHWPTLRGWLENDEVFLAWSARLHDLRDSGGQLSGAPLAEASDWLRKRPADIPPAQREFITRGEAVQRRSQRRWRTITAISATLALVAVVLTGAVGKFASDVDGQLRINNARLLAQAAERAAEVDPRQALQLALAAYREKPDSDEAYVALLDQRLRWDGVNRVLGPELIPDADVDRLQVNSDGRVVVAFHTDQSKSPTLWWDLEGPHPRHRELPVDPSVSAPSQVAPSPDGRMLIVLERGAAPRFRLLDLTAGDRPITLASPDGFAQDRADVANFSWNSRFLATHSIDDPQTVRVWDLATGQELPDQVRLEPNTTLETLFPSSDGKSLITKDFTGGSAPDTVVHWDLASGRRLSSHPIESQDTLAGNGTILAKCDESGVHAVDLFTDRVAAELPGTPCLSLKTDLTGQYLVSDVSSGA
ncbi:trypsin-like peptidase domain-containing protein [Saccharopolyspora gloriosae]|uniref:nSTAND1 domain-containing NTPase n=1 Tax=Saccharopolyspora gloriosae TaxID=455344 RepID=UPI001FB736F3|nr:trypsin-like peptidase domain-containing protein [Saccharopolyspora gloriosae]